MNSLELFSGAGGLAKGLELSGFKHAALVENNKHACASLRENFDAEKVFFGDVRDFDLEKLTNIDLVAGGPPCQPFSLVVNIRRIETNAICFQRQFTRSKG